LTSGFIVKYQVQGYAFQVMETTGSVKVAVVNLNDAATKSSEAERVAYAEGIIRSYFLPQPADPLLLADPTLLSKYQSEGRVVTMGVWSPIKNERLPNGQLLLPSELRRKSRFIDITFATDGRLVVFEANKNLVNPSDAQRPRFTAPTFPAAEAEINKPWIIEPVTPYKNEKKEQLLHPELTAEELKNEVN
jgi:hypothetical protein